MGQWAVPPTPGTSTRPSTTGRTGERWARATWSSGRAWPAARADRSWSWAAGRAGCRSRWRRLAWRLSAWISRCRCSGRRGPARARPRSDRDCGSSDWTSGRSRLPRTPSRQSLRRTAFCNRCPAPTGSPPRSTPSAACSPRAGRFGSTWRSRCRAGPSTAIASGGGSRRIPRGTRRWLSRFGRIGRNGRLSSARSTHSAGGAARSDATSSSVSTRGHSACFGASSPPPASPLSRRAITRAARGTADRQRSSCERGVRRRGCYDV